MNLHINQRWKVNPIKRIAIIEFIHESNSFSQTKTNIHSFKNHGEYDECGLLYEKELMKVHRGKKTGLGGFIYCCEKYEWEIVPILAADTVPSGMLDTEAFQIISASIYNLLKENKRQGLDGVLLHLHGSTVSEQINDVGGEVLKQIRLLVGAIPIISVFDFHANMTDLMIKNSDICLGYNEEPHEDIYERGVEAGNLMDQMLRGSIHPKTIRIQPPLILPAINMATAYGPMHEIFKEVYKAEGYEDIINVSVFGGFYGSDSFHAGPSVVVTTNNNLNLAKKIADRLSKKLWDLRREFMCNTINLELAVAVSKKSEGLTILIDEADDPAGGAPCDGTAVLRELMSQNIKNAGLCTICDPEIVEMAFHAGEGNVITGYLGGKADQAHGESIYIQALVKTLRTDALPWNEQDGNLQNTGRMALLDIDEIYVVVTEKKTVTEDINAFSYFNLNVSLLNIVVAKGLGLHIKEVFKGIAKEYMTVDGIGITHPDVRRFHYKNLRRPCFPFDEIAWMPV